jgi:hypothetical protein
VFAGAGSLFESHLGHGKAPGRELFVFKCGRRLARRARLAAHLARQNAWELEANLAKTER